MLLTRHTPCALLVATLYAGPAWAQKESASQCIAAHEAAVGARKGGRLIEAREQFAKCSEQACPAVIREDCAAEASATKDRIPKLTLSVRTEDGTTPADVTVTIDGASQSLDGRAMELDPGSHEVVVVAGGKTHERTIVLTEGAPPERLVIRLESPSTPAGPTEGGSGVHPATWVLGGAALVGFGLFATFGILGKQREGELDECAPACAADDVQSMRDLYLAADIGLIAGAAFGIAALTVGLVVRPTDDTAVSLSPRGATLAVSF